MAARAQDTVDITPVVAPATWQAAFDRVGVQGGRVNEEGALEVSDAGLFMRTLAQAALTAHVEATMVLPSNADALRGRIAREIHELAVMESRTERRELARDLVVDLRVIAALIEGGT